MMKNKLFSFSIALVICISACVITACNNSSDDTKNIVKNIDHIMLISEDAEGIKFFLSNVFQLPEAWPYKNYYGFSTGGVFAGNVRIEAANDLNYLTETSISGLALEPDGTTEQMIAEMNRRNIPNKLLEKNDSYTTTGIINILPGSWIFFCEFHFDKAKAEAYLMRLKAQLEEENGGPLGIEYVSELRLMVDSENRIKNWRKLLAPFKENTDYFFKIGEGPSLRFVKSNKNCIDAIKFKVRSLDKALKYLKECKILGKEERSLASTDPDKTYGVLFEFSEI